MPNLNKFIGCGHLAKDPELRKTQGGHDVCSFAVGISSSEKVNGEWQKVTEWVNGVVFGKQAEWLGEAQKGDLVIFEGRLKTRSWEKDGVKQYKTEVVCDSAQAVKKGAKPNSVHSVNYEKTSENTGLVGWADEGDAIPFMRLFDDQF